MEPLTDLAITLRSVPYEERHRVVTALTEKHGKISALARNSVQSRRFGGALDPFTASTWMFTEKPGSNLYSLQSAQAKRGFEELRTQFEALALASFLNELMLQLAPEREACTDLFKLHSNALSRLSECATEREPTRTALILLNVYLAKLLQWSGAQPQVMHCFTCQKRIEDLAPTDPISFLISNVAWLCENCRLSGTAHIQATDFRQSMDHVALRITAAALHDFFLALTVPLRQAIAGADATEEEHRDLFKLIEAVLVYYVPGFNPSASRSLKFLGIESIALREPMNPPQRKPDWALS